MGIYYYATGKRKCCCARVFLQYTPGKGLITINNKVIETYNYLDREFILQPLKLVNMLGEFSIKITVKGGGFYGQLDSIRYGIAKALVKYDSAIKLDESIVEERVTFRKILKKQGFMTRDSRVVERKKFGFKKARKREQYSKR